MARLKCLGSSSSGNCFILECSGEILLLDLGVAFRKVLKSLNYGKDMERVRGCLVSHL